MLFFVPKSVNFFQGKTEFAAVAARRRKGSVVQKAYSRGLRKSYFHNGTESRLLLPLRHGDGRATRTKLVGSASEVSRFITKSIRWR